ncbi:cold-regulated 413 inner membrane protein 1, chloroplastic [Solanum lycopersicum]|uniref:Cold-regulated 413 inner membrane protein 1, chloroplastic n=1 Tax=Solanum lycopersicum TaxID=4081 RepID=A0A3Q7F488_SOLLC|nr:cold-regulated 413 inner membrane protein 1, chloroplastic [Solanum lycopersicum]
MMSLSLSLSYPIHRFASYNKQLCALRSPQSHHTRISQHKLQQSSSFLGYNPLRVSIDVSGEMNMKRRGGVVCSAAALTPRNLQWVCTISSVVLMLAKGTAIHKSFLVPLFALQAPTAVVSWIQGEYGIWSAFLALLVRLFFSFPGELELPFIALLMVIVAPYQVANLRGTKEGVILSLAIAAYLGFQHFTRAGSLQKAFDQGSIIATLAIICILAVPCLLLI